MCEQQDASRSKTRTAPAETQATPTLRNPIGSASSILPTGTVTFLFTDIEGSTQLWERDPEAMRRAFSRQEIIMREAMAAYGGYIYKMIGDAFQVAFSTAPAALAAALAAQRVLNLEPWGLTGKLKVRMALHSGVAEERGDDYVGPDLNRIARLLSAGHGGQVLLSEATADLVRDHLPEGISLRNLGEHLLRDLIRPEHIYQAVAQGLPDDFAPLKTVDTRPHNLPSPATPFIGREAELAQISALLADPQCRLISLVGLGGSGKTRLSIQAATQSQGFPDGVYFVGLAAISTLEGMISTIAHTLEMSFYFRPGSSPTPEAAQDQLLRYLAGKKALLVLDNMEQLISSANLVADLLEAAPGVKVVVTSRERLNLPGEWVLEVTGLSFPSSGDRETISQYPAVQLFVESAKRAGAFAAAASDWPAIARICQLLGGMPLGVEMAAAWTKVLSCQEIAAEFGRDLLSLIATWRTVPERHRTLRTVVDHSWRLLSEEERDVFCRLSVFRGNFSREAAAEVAGASLLVLGTLIDKSILRRAGERRFEIHSILRQCAAEKLAADPAAYTKARTRHAQYYSEWLSRMNEKLKGGEQLAALGELRTETQDLYDAWRWLIEQRDLERLHRVLPAMILFHEMHGRPVEAQEIVRLLLDTLRALGYVPGSAVTAAEPTMAPRRTADPSCDSLLALALAALRHFSLDFQHWERTNPYQRESLEIAQKLPDGQEKAFTLMLNSMGPGILTAQQILGLCEQSIDLFGRLGDVWGAALARLILADAANFGSVDAELARRSYQASLEDFAGLGNDWGRALCLTGLAHIEYRSGHLEKAYQMGCQALATHCQMGDTWRSVLAHYTLGGIAEELGALDRARHHFEANLAHFAQLGDERQRDFYFERLQRLGEKAGAAAPDTPQNLAPPGTGAQQEGASSPVHSSGPPTPRSSALTDPLVEPLSAREIEVLQHLAEGLTNREIAQQLFLSPNTVRVHTSHIYGKLGVNNRTQAVTRARALGLLSSS